MQFIKKAISFFSFSLYLYICWACPYDHSNDVSSASGSQNLDPKIIDQQEGLIDKLKEIKDNDLNVFVFNVGQGNFVILRYYKNLVIIDAGNIAGRADNPQTDFESYYNDHKDVLDAIINGAQLKAVIITHPDADHYNYIPGFVDMLKNKNQQKDFNACCFFVSKNNDENYKYLKIKETTKDNITKAVVITTANFVEQGEILNKLLFEESDKNKISFLNPIEMKKGENLGNNDFSLVVKVSFNDTQSILFTGDATGKTLDSIWQSDKSSLNTHFLIAPHHGAATDGSLLWPMYINSLNPYNFAGAIFSAPLGSDNEENKQQQSTYGHPNAYIQRLNLQNRVFSHYSKYHYGKGKEAKTKLTTKPIFVTGCVTHLYWLNFSQDNGMSIFHNNEFYQLVSSKGWTTLIKKLIDGFKTEDKTIFHATMARFFQTPEILKCQCTAGTKLGNILNLNLEMTLPYRTEETMYSVEVLKLFKFWVNSNAAANDLKRWWESKTSLVVRKRSSSIFEKGSKMEEESLK